MVKSKCVVKSKSLALALGSIIVTARAADTEGDVYCEDTVGVIGVILASNRYNHLPPDPACQLKPELSSPLHREVL